MGGAHVAVLRALPPWRVCLAYDIALPFVLQMLIVSGRTHACGVPDLAPYPPVPARQSTTTTAPCWCGHSSLPVSLCLGDVCVARLRKRTHTFQRGAQCPCSFYGTL